jgi:hypothetical protein
MASSRILCWRALGTSPEGTRVESFGVTREGAVAIFRTIAARLGWTRNVEAFVIPIVPGALLDGEPDVGFEDLVEAGGSGLARSRLRTKRR